MKVIGKIDTRTTITKRGGTNTNTNRQITRFVLRFFFFSLDRKELGKQKEMVRYLDWVGSDFSRFHIKF